jgi:hypothetical protein
MRKTVPLQKAQEAISEFASLAETHVSLREFLKANMTLFLKYIRSGGTVRDIHAQLEKNKIDVGSYQSFAAYFSAAKKDASKAAFSEGIEKNKEV